MDTAARRFRKRRRGGLRLLICELILAQAHRDVQRAPAEAHDASRTHDETGGASLREHPLA